MGKPPAPPVAMVLAAGRGRRLGELGRRQAKATLPIGGVPMIVSLLRRLRKAGVERVVINLHHLGEQVEELVGDGRRVKLDVVYSREAELLDVGGGIANALPLLGDRPFIVANADIVSDYDLARLVKLTQDFGDRHGHLVLGSNPDLHPDGDFALEDGQIKPVGDTPGLTYIGTAAYAPAMFADVPTGEPWRMMALWEAAMVAGRLTGERHTGTWLDGGTQYRLAAGRLPGLD